MIKILSNEIVDKKRSVREGTSNQKPYRPFVRRPTPPRVFEPPHADLNLDIGRVATDNYFNFHQDFHYEKTCSQWINAMNLVTDRLLDESAQV
jgi:hypothetical protein